MRNVGKRLTSGLAIVLILHTMVVGESLAAVASLLQFSTITGQDAAEAISRETRPRMESRVGNSVDAGTGAFILELPIVNVSGGRDLAFTLTYNSLLTDTVGPVGYGWSHNYESFIDVDSVGNVTVHWDRNRKNSFTFVSDVEPYAPDDEAVTYDRLVRGLNDTWRLTKLDGTLYEFQADGQLSRIANKVLQYLEVNRNDNRVATVREPISDKTLYLYYDADGLLESIEDSRNFREKRIYHFGYDSSQRLTVLRDPVHLGDEYGNCCPRFEIPDGDPSGFTYEINVAESDPIGLLQVTVGDIDHPDPTELQVTVISPLGTELLLHDRESVDGVGLDFSKRVLDTFEGENPSGNWRVRVVDSVPGNSGQLVGWAMRFSEPTNPTTFNYDGFQISAAHGPGGEQLYRNSYDVGGRVASQDDGVSANQIATFQYEDLPDGGVRTRYSNRLGQVTAVEHDARYRLLSVTDPLGHTSTWEYNSSGDRIRAKDALGQTTVFNYDAAGNLITVVDPAGSVSIFEYVGGNVIKIRDALGKETTFTYDPNNNLKKIRDALGNEDNKDYNANSQMTGNLLAGRGGIDIQYPNGLPTSFGHPAENGNVGMEYDEHGQVTKITDLDGFTTTMKYSVTGQVIEQTDHLGNTVFSEYDRRDRLVKKIDPRGNETLFSYDGNNNLLTQTDPLDRVIRHEYDGEDRLIRTTDPVGNVSTVAYDAAGHVIQETDPLGNRVTHVYDAVGNEVATYDAKGIKIREVDYEDRNFPVATRDALGHASTLEYDAVGRITQATNALGRTTFYEYDALDRPTGVRDPINRVSSKEYWADDFVRRLRNPRGFGTEFRYDQARRLDRITTATGKRTTLDYNRRDLLTRVTKPSGRIYDYTYDELGRLTRFVSSGGGGIFPAIHYEYDNKGNLVTVSRKAFADIEPVPRLRRTFDELDRMTSFTDGQGNRLDYDYDNAGNLSALIYPDGRRVDYGYDAANRLTTVTDWAGRVTRYVYDSNSQLIRAEFPNGTTRRLEYDPNGRILLRRDSDAQGGMIVGYRYSYDAAGQISAEALEHQAPPYDPPTVTMTYDNDDRLQTFNSQAVSFDSDGNMTRGPLGPTFSFQNFSYDDRTNLTSAGGVSYGYDEEDRLVSFTDGEGTTRLVVSPSGDLSQVVQKTASSGSTTQYVYGIGLVYEVNGSQIKVYHYDHRGSTAAFSGDGGVVVGRVAYGPFGEIIQRTGEVDSLFLFSGLFGVISEPTNELYYMRYRWYSPQIKRFVNADAHYGDIALPHTLNRFAYTGNNPINRIDPGGEFFSLIGAAIGGVASAVIKVASDAISGRPVDFTSGDYWAEIGGAFVSGAVTGACIGTGVGLVAGAACGAAGSSLGYLTTQGLKGEQVDPGQLAFEAGVGAASGALTAGAARFIRFGPKTSAGNRFTQFRQGFRADSPTNFKLGLLARDKVIMGSDEYLITNILAKSGARKLVGTSVGKEVGKALARRAFTPTFGLLAGGSLGVKVGGRIAANIIFNSQSGGVPGSGEDNTDIEEEGRTAVSRGVKGEYGEYIHWRLYINSLVLAGRPVPNNPNNILATF